MLINVIIITITEHGSYKREFLFFVLNFLVKPYLQEMYNKSSCKLLHMLPMQLYIYIYRIYFCILN
jgi:hypothetical protein